MFRTCFDFLAAAGDAQPALAATESRISCWRKNLYLTEHVSSNKDRLAHFERTATLPDLFIDFAPVESSCPMFGM